MTGRVSHCVLEELALSDDLVIVLVTSACWGLIGGLGLEGKDEAVIMVSTVLLGGGEPLPTPSSETVQNCGTSGCAKS